MAKEKIYKATKANIHKDIDNSTIPQMLKALYQLANGVEILSRQSFNRIKAVYASFGIHTNENELLAGINDYCKSVRLATTQFTTRIEPMIQGATFDCEKDAGEGAYVYDSFQCGSSNLIMFSLLLIDRITNDGDAFMKVMDFLESLPSKGIFNEGDYKRFLK